MTARSVAFEFPGMKLVNPTNDHSHWRRRWVRSKPQRHAGMLAAHAKMRGVSFATCVVTITRLSRGVLDDDSLPPSAKHLRDGIADGLGLRDNDPRITWRYAQRKANGYGVEVTIEWTEREVA